MRTLTGDGANFSLFSRSATRVELLLFNQADDASPSRVLNWISRPSDLSLLARVRAGVKQGNSMAIASMGRPNQSAACDSIPTKVLLDRHGRGVVVRRVRRQAATQPGDNAASAMKSVVADPAAYDWQGDAPLRRPSAQTVIYEMRRGLHAPSQFRHRGSKARTTRA